MAEETKRTSTRNIVLFGQTGAGKSSIINMLAGSQIADASGGARGVTSSNQQYSISRDGNYYTFWDTPGLNESEDGAMSPQDAVQNLLNLIKEHGVNLLIYCIRGRLVDIIGVNYELVWKFICLEKVPIVLVVTGLEGEADMDGWWGENQKTIERFKIKPIGHACITSWKGRNNINERKYKESAEKVWTLVRKHCGPIWDMPSDWHVQFEGYAKRNDANVGSGKWIRKFVQELVRLFSLGKIEISTS